MKLLKNILYGVNIQQIIGMTNVAVESNDNTRPAAYSKHRRRQLPRFVRCSVESASCFVLAIVCDLVLINLGHFFLQVQHTIGFFELEFETLIFTCGAG